MNKFYKYVLFFAIALLIQIPANAACSKNYTLGFFNGVWNSKDQADTGRDKLRSMIGDTYNNEPVKYEAFYNHTGATVNSNGLQDLAETFIQRSAEIDKSGVMGKRFEYFWEFLGSSEPTFLDKIKGIFPNATTLFDALYTTFATKLAAIISGILSNPPTEADYATHNARLDALAADGQKLMLVGHSQGNLFMNHAYDHILPVVTKDRVAAAHIAPASPTLRGDYVLTDIDLVINAMRVQGGLSVPDNNLDLNSSSVDVSGHTLIGTYLDGTRAGRATIKTMIEVAMGGLKCLNSMTQCTYFRYMDFATALAAEQAKLRYPDTLDPDSIQEFTQNYAEFMSSLPAYQFGAPRDYLEPSDPGYFPMSHYGGDLYTLSYSNGTVVNYRRDRIISVYSGGQCRPVSLSQLPDFKDYTQF